jgi:dTDP-3-amino-3,4,6-trideoxy-alpha-D-glucose transaminase
MTEAQRVPFQSLQLPAEIEGEIDRAVKRVLQSAHFILGKEVEAFESELAAYLGVRRVVGVASGTDALTLALLASDVARPGSEVIVPALTSPFTAVAVVRAGARPVFADVNAATWTLDPAATAAAVTERTAAILPVHLYGNPADWPSLSRIARDHNLVLIEDACQAHGAALDGIRAGGLGMAAAFSFYPTKNLGALGDGGAVATNDLDLADRCVYLRNGAQTRRYVHDRPMFHSRLDELQAAVLRVKLRHLEAWNLRRRIVCDDYRERLAGFSFPEVRSGAVPAAHLAAVCHPRRDSLRAHLASRAIETLIHYPVPLHRMPAFEPHAPSQPGCPDAERICERLVSLPLSVFLSRQDQEAVVNAVNEFPADA